MKRRDECIEERLSYREPRKIEEIHILKNGYEYALCPRCKRIFDTEFQPFCSECGQAIDWKKSKETKRIRLFT